MNFLKSLFISMYMTLAMALAGYAAWSLWHHPNQISWYGLLLTTLPILMTLGRLMMLKDRARTSAYFPFIHILVAAGVLLSLSMDFRQNSMLASTLSITAWIGFLLYAFWYSRFGRDFNPLLRVGLPLPSFSLKDSTGLTVKSSSLFKQPTIWIFYRGNWCPLCMAQIKELAAQYQELENLGVQVALISPQPHRNTISLANKFNLGFHFFTDANNIAARALRIENPNGLPLGMQMLGYKSETVLPTVIITDATGKIVWTHQTDNYRLRPEPEVFLSVLREKNIISMAA